jgi:hypothetical protein
MRMVFTEGAFGIAIMGVVVAITSLAPCPNLDYMKDKCMTYNGASHIDSLPVFFQQIGTNKMLLLFIICFLISMSISVPLAVTISKLINPVSRALADVCRTVLIWGFCLLLTLELRNDEQYQLEDIGVLVNLLKLAGFALVVIGTLMYHEIIRFPGIGDGSSQTTRLLDEDDSAIQNEQSESKQSIVSSESSITSLPTRREQLM